jgi:hypothetical protein
MTVPALVEELKQNGQDHEWYPTTDEIIGAVARDLKEEFGEGYGERLKVHSILDIGAGNGKVLLALQRFPGINRIADWLCVGWPGSKPKKRNK